MCLAVSFQCLTPWRLPPRSWTAEAPNSLAGLNRAPSGSRLPREAKCNHPHPAAVVAVVAAAVAVSAVVDKEDHCAAAATAVVVAGTEEAVVAAGRSVVVVVVAAAVVESEWDRERPASKDGDRSTEKERRNIGIVDR